jgi:AAA+ superfamily predicted ATPase
MDDLQEFMERALSVVEPADMPDLPRKVRTQASDTKEEKIMTLTQYSRIGDGYCPTSNTTPKLPPDCYNVVMTGDGAIVFMPQKLVTDDLLRLPDSKSEAVIEEITKFWTLKERFNEFGFSHKRGFLLWGPPGSGKTSTVAITVRDTVKAGGLVLLADHPFILTKGLRQLRDIEPERPLVVIWEDIDTIILNYGESQVLSVLDGESQVENVVFIATTNYPERLDGRVVNRPSRFDKIVKIGMPNSAAREMYLKSKLNSTVKDGIDLVEATEGLSIAHIKELIVSTECQGNPAKEVLERLKKMKVKPVSDDEHTPMGFSVGLGGGR